MDILLIIMAFVFGIVSAVGIILNVGTPMQVGPVPVIGGGVLFVVCVLALVARHLVWR